MTRRKASRASFPRTQDGDAHVSSPVTDDRNVCPVCGYPDLEEPPRSPVTSGGSYEICPSCGFQFGVTDDDEGFSYQEWRTQWIQRGMPWDSEEIRPPPQGWDPARQLANLEDAEKGTF